MTVDWNTWQPQERATLCFVMKGDYFLLIRKKRGLGAGKINAPGGKLEPGETPLACAIREAQEEVGVTPIQPVKRGELSFQFTNGYGVHCHVFVARDCEGEPYETDEATPYWIHKDEVPYHEMWADDLHWVPLLVEEKMFRGYFVFDEEIMLSKRLEIEDGINV